MERKYGLLAAITVWSTMLLMLVSNTKTVYAATKTPVPDEYSAIMEYSVECLGAAASESNATSGSNATSTKATGKSKAEKAANKLVDLGEYWGWSGVVDRVKVAKKESSAYVTLSNSRYVFGDIKIKSTSKKTTYTFKGTKYTLAGWKSSLKDYSSAKDRQAMLESKAEAAARKLQQYGNERSWTSKLATKFKNKKASSTVNFTNAKYNYKVVVTTARSSGKITTSYKAQGKKSTAKGIKQILQKYKVTATASTAKTAKAVASYGSSLNGSSGAPKEDDTKVSVSLETTADSGNDVNEENVELEPVTDATDENIISENTISENIIPEDTISENTISEDTISENIIFENTVSDNSVSDNSLELVESDEVQYFNY